MVLQPKSAEEADLNAMNNSQLPEVAYSPGLEVRPQQYTNPDSFHGLRYMAASPKEAIVISEDRGVSSNGRRICGLRKSTFWLLAVLIFVVVAAAIGGGVRSTLAVKHANESKASATLPSNTTQLPSTTTSSPSSASPSPSTSATPYTPLAPIDVLRIVNSCPSSNLSSFYPQSFTCKEKSDVVGNDITGLIAYTLQACVDACSTYNAVNGGEGCKAAVLNWALSGSYISNKGANCWLKGVNAGDGDVVGSAYGTVAMLT